MKFKDTLIKMKEEEYYDPLSKYDNNSKEYFLEYNHRLGYIYASMEVYGGITYHDCVKYDVEAFKAKETDIVLEGLKEVLDKRYEIYK